MVLSEAAQMRLDETMKKMEAKIELARLKWFEDNFEKIFNDPFRPSHLKPKKGEELYKKILEVRREEMQREEDIKREDQRKDQELRNKLLAMVENRDSIYDEVKDVMYPVPPHARHILFNGVSKSGEGRQLYLKVRNEVAPYEKFRRKVTESQAYGWKIEEFAERPVKDFNRLAIIKDSFYRRFGAIKPDSLRKNPPFTKAQVTVEVL